MKKIVAFVFSLILFGMIGISHGQESTIKIYTDRQNYYFGDVLTFTIEVSEITGDSAILHIVDSLGKKGSGIPINITQKETTITAPRPFESMIYGEGRYVLEIEYSGNHAKTEFFLSDSGRIVIPSWIKDLAIWWLNGTVTEKEFAQGIEFMIKNDIIKIPKTESQEQESQVIIPVWIKTSTGWWIEGKISDDEFGKSLQYLIKVGIIVA